MIMLRLCLCAALCGTPLAGCVEMIIPERQPEPRGPRLSDGFTLHWMTTTDERELKKGLDWSARFDFAGLPVRRDAVVLYEHWFAADVREKGFELVRDPLYRPRLREQLTRCLNQRVPARDFEGLICIDIEFAVPWWGDRTNGPGLSGEIPHGTKYFDAWEKFIERTEPGVLAGKNANEREHALETTYTGAVKHWMTMVIEEARSLRPAARFGFYGIPAGSRYDNDYAGPKAAEFRALNDKAAWMIDVSDVVMLPLYQEKAIVRGLERQVTPREITQKQGREYIASNIEEAKRLAKGKPVYALAMIQYSHTLNDFLPHLAGKPFNEENLNAMFRFPKEHGADGIIVWGHFDSEAGFREAQTQWSTRIAPVLREVVDE